MFSSRFHNATGSVGPSREGAAGRVAGCVLLGAVLGSLLGMAGAATGLRAEPATALALSDAWVRAMPPGQTMTAAYLQIANHGDKPVTVTGVRAGRGMASLHETQTVDGRSTMRPLASLTIAPGDRMQLQPGGPHIMLMGLERTPVTGEEIVICLVTAAGEDCTDAPVSRGPVANDTHAGPHH